MTKMNMVDAINNALDNEMANDKSIVLLGEDIGEDGGVFRVTDGLAKKYGNNRVMDSPLAEAGIMGVSIGMAVMGLKPVPEIQFDGFSITILDQVYNHASRIRNRSRGLYHCPITLRCPIGGGIRALEHHSESPETFFAHIPGIKVVIPSGPYEAKGLLISSIRDPDPVIFYEPKRIYRAIKEDVPEKPYTIPLGKANIVREGKSLTLITYGSWLRESLEAVEELKTDIEVIDLRTISPLDTGTIISSVKKTGRAVIVHEAPKNLGIAAEIMARINEGAFYSLEAPIERVTGYDTIMPLASYEQLYLLNKEKIKKAITKVLSVKG
jgi:pyruvate dehydrogenase E1 component beta subunit